MGRIGTAFLALGLLIPVASSNAFAQEGGPASSKAKREGQYAGVVPGDHPGRVRGQRAKKPTLTWIGFQPREDRTSRFFVQLNREAGYEQRVDDKGVLHVWVRDVKFGSRNAQRRLETQFFDTRVAKVTARRVRAKRARGSRPAEPAGVRLDFYFKQARDAGEASATMSKDEDGFYYLYLDFAPSSDDGEPDAPAEEPAADDSVDEPEPQGGGTPATDDENPL